MPAKTTIQAERPKDGQGLWQYSAQIACMLLPAHAAARITPLADVDPRCTKRLPWIDIYFFVDVPFSMRWKRVEDCLLRTSRDAVHNGEAHHDNELEGDDVPQPAPGPKGILRRKQHFPLFTPLLPCESCSMPASDACMDRKGG